VLTFVEKREVEGGQGDAATSQMVVHGEGNRQLAVVPENGVGALVHVEVKAAKKNEVLVFPPFMGKQPKKLLKGDSGEATSAYHICWVLGYGKWYKVAVSGSLYLGL
jgi:hypothetical protein